MHAEKINLLPQRSSFYGLSFYRCPLSRILLVLLFVYCAFAQRLAVADALIDNIHQYESKNKSVAVGFLLEQGNTTLQAYQADNFFMPASVQKIFTSNAVLKTLGGDAVFKTEFLYDSSQQALFIIPSADPSITGESLLGLLRVMEAYHLKNIKKVVLLNNKDDTTIVAHGVRAYEAGVAPLSFNFNAIGFRICPTKKGQPAAVIPFSSLLDTTMQNKVMTTDGIKEAGVAVDPIQGGWLLTGGIDVDSSCADIYRSTPYPKVYVLNELKKLGRAFDVVFSTEQIEEKSEIPSSAKELYTIQSKPVKELVTTMNQQSSNFFADQFVLAIGKEVSGTFSFAAGLEKIRSFIKNPGTKIVDGSGLSRTNTTTPKTLLATFRGLLADDQYRAEFESSLPSYGSSGTLKRRKADLDCVIHAKTGTLDGVSSLVGVLYKPESNVLPAYFSLLQNGTTSIEQGHLFEDEMLKKICDGLH